jgi:hypothetical protein
MDSAHASKMIILCTYQKKEKEKEKERNRKIILCKFFVVEP